MQTSIRPGRPWLDITGQRIHAHGGSVYFENDTFFWYGENKERTVPGSGIWHWGVRCYASTDLYNWNDLGTIIPPVPNDPDSPLHPAQKMDRPHIVFNSATGKYVCWLKIMGDGDEQRSTVLVADHLLGPYEIVRTGLSPLGMNAGDFDLVVDRVDGAGYYYFERVHSELICADLTDDYTDVTGRYTTHFPHPHPPYVREAPAHFERHGKHYLVTSGTSGYFPNQSEIAVADTYHGPWTVLGNPHPTDPSLTSFRSQVSSVFKHPGADDLYIAVADRWIPALSEDLASGVSARIASIYEGGDYEAPPHDIPAFVTDPDTSVADYVWLPLRFDGDVPTIEWYDEWRVEDYL